MHPVFFMFCELLPKNTSSLTSRKTENHFAVTSLITSAVVLQNNFGELFGVLVVFFFFLFLEFIRDNNRHCLDYNGAI